MHNQKQELALNKTTIILFFLSLFLPTIAVSQSNDVNKSDKKQFLKLEFAVDAGFYNQPIFLEMYADDARIFYTVDGQEPNTEAFLYEGPVLIDKTTVIRAKAYKGKMRSKIKSSTFFIDEPKTTFPTVSIIMPPEELFDPDRGMFVRGTNAVDTTWKKTDANFWGRKEIKIHTEIYENDKRSVFDSNTGFRLFGGMSRLFPQKSFTLVARDRYGKKRIRHKIFGEDGAKKFKFLVLRNSGSDWGKSHFRDGLMTSLVEDWDIEKQDYRPSHVYINGKYWGIYNIREKVNRYFVDTYHDVDKDSIDLIEHRMSLKRGSTRDYKGLLAFFQKRDMADPINYEYIQTKMELENFMDYQIAQIFFNNKDAGGNIKFWKPQVENGKWRWILYDTDWGFNLHDSKGHKVNSLKFHTAENGPEWPNPPWSTLILRSLLENDDFRNKFVNRFMDRLNTSFQKDVVLQKIDEFSATLRPEIGRHFKRWKLSPKTYKSHIKRMRKFAFERPTYMKAHLKEYFEAGAEVSLKINPTQGGDIVLNGNLKIRDQHFSGKYFDNIPITLQAVPDYGFKFSHWEGVSIENEDNNDLTFNLPNEGLDVKAVFVPYVHPLEGKVFVNEISANDKKAGDWVEIFNNGDHEVDLENWLFTDKNNYFRLPPFILEKGAYVIVSQDTALFRKNYPAVNNVIGNFKFGLNKSKEQIGLYSQDAASIDSVAYEITSMKKTFSLSLLMPHLDNGDPTNWEVNFGKGTPESPNPFYLYSEIKSEQEQWIRIGVGVGIFLCAMLLLTFRDRRHGY